MGVIVGVGVIVEVTMRQKLVLLGVGEGGAGVEDGTGRLDLFRCAAGEQEEQEAA